MAVNNPCTIHALVRLLKSPTDPPSAPGPSKIEIARLAWSDPSFPALNKGEVIGEWILTVLGQAKKTRGRKDASFTFNPIADYHHWTLLCDVLTTSSSATARPIKTWLLPLLNRLQVSATITELLTLRSPQVLAPARAVLAVIWPLAEKKIDVDALGECLGAVFNACTEWERMDHNLDWICSTVIATYRNALASAGNKRKHYHVFLSSQLSSWFYAIRASPFVVTPSSAKHLQDCIYTAGTETLFSLDALKQPLGILFDALSSSIPSPFSILPKLCTSFLSAIHRHRSTLFASASSVADGKGEVRKKGMEFIERCLALVRFSSGPQEDLEVEKWKSVIGVLRIVEKERLFKARFTHGVHTDAPKGEYGGELTLTEARDKAVEMLEAVGASSRDLQAGQAALCIQLLDVLVQVEYDFVGSVLERVLSALISIHQLLSHLLEAASSEFLTHVLEYHTKTRTVDAYALALLNAGVAAPASWTYTSRSTVRTLPFVCHLPVLARALRTSLTPTQTTPLATSVLQAIENAWRAFMDAEEERSAKKQKVTGDTEKSGCEIISGLARAQMLSYTGRIAGTILSNLPASAYAIDEEYSLECLWSDVGKLGWTIVWECLREKTRKGDGTVKGRDSKKRKHAIETSPLSTLHPSIVASAALRFLYDVRARVSHLLGDCDRLGEAHVGTLLNVVRDEVLDPELVLEIIRTLLWHIWYTYNRESKIRIETQPTFSAILGILTARPLSNSEWSGVSTVLTRDNLGLAILYVLTERWIDALDALASTENLERFIPLLLVSLDLSDEDTRGDSNEIDLQPDHVVITLRGIVFRLLRNAQFWELHNIRAVFLSSVLTLTTPLSPCSFATVGIESPSPTTVIAHTDLILACNVYHLLHYVPPEYFTRPLRVELVKRAMAADVQICMVLEGVKEKRTDDKVLAEESKKWSCQLTFIRVFLQRMGQFMGTSTHSISLTFINHLLNPPLLSSPSEVLATVTLDLVQLYTRSLLRSQGPEAAAFISRLIAAKPFSQTESQETWAQLVVQSSVLKFIECTTDDFDRASLPDQVKCALMTLLEDLELVLSSYAEGLVGNDVRQLDQFLSSKHINAWSCMLSLRRWLGVNSPVAVVPLGLKLATVTIYRKNSARLDPETSSSVLGLLFEELWSTADATHHVYLDVLVCFYAVNGGLGPDSIMDIYVMRALKKMAIKDFAYLLDILEEDIGGSKLRTDHRERLIHLGQVLLHDAPQGTLKIIQHFATRCFDLFTDREATYGSSSRLKLRYLEFVARYCSDRPGAIRSVDLGSIWSFLNKVLSGSSYHDATTVFPIFHHIITIVGALIRLRRDLVVHTLPHLGLVLRQLMMLTRKIRPQLGTKQSKIVADTFPQWLSAPQPLSTNEARALSRLLTSLTTKTVPRTHAYASTESHKAESLAKPFAKHASYILTAYVDAFNDPLCIMDAETRKELEPGLFALCEMVGEHNRDALMVSALDAGGKMILKSLWKEYEKQRYVGKG